MDGSKASIINMGIHSINGMRKTSWDDYLAGITLLVLLVSNAVIFISGILNVTLTIWDAFSAGGVTSLMFLVLYMSQKK